MMINAFGGKFQVIHKAEITPQYTILTCKKYPGDREYTFLQIRDSSQVKAFIPRFYEMQKNDVFKDYLGCFTNHGALFLGFKKQTGLPLSTILLNAALPADKRLLLFKKILEKLLLFKLPCFMAVQLLNTDRILVCDDVVAFDYSLTPSAEVSEFNCKLADLFEEMFRQELDSGSSRTMTEFLRRLKGQQDCTILNVFDAFSSSMELIIKELDSYVPLKERIREEIKEMTDCWKKASCAILLAVSYIAMAAGLLAGIKAMQEEEKKKQEQGITFEQIGTLPIE